MSLFVLREGYRVVTTPSGARVVHVRTGGALDVSPEEVLLFARATAGGVDAKDPKLRDLVRRFVTLGVLVSAGDASKNDKNRSAPVAAGASPPSAAAAEPEGLVAALQAAAKPPTVARSPSPPPSPTSSTGKSGSDSASPARSATLAAFSIPGLTSPAPAGNERTVENGPPPAGPGPRPRNDDTIRLLRTDLKVSRRNSSSLLDVTDPTTGKTFPLYDFEVSLARMLDGRRLYSEVVEAGQRLGIPVDFESLGQFVAQLDRYGFLAPAGTRTPEPRDLEAMWAPREKWDEGLRALFQSGLRMHRQGRYAEAANYFEAMIQQDPQNPEALEMLEQSRQRMTGGQSGTSEVILSPPDSAQVPLENLFFGDDEAPPAAPAPVEPPPTPKLAPSLRPQTGVWSAERAAPAAKRRGRWPAVTVIGCSLAVSLAAGWYLVSVYRAASAAKLGLNRAARVERQKPAAAAADAGSNQVAAAGSDAGKEPRELQRRPPEADVQLAKQNMTDAGEQHPITELARTTSTASAVVIPRVPPQTGSTSEADAGLPAQAAALTSERVAGPDSAVSEEARGDWIAAKIEHRGRVTMAEVEAPASGVISWKASPSQRVRRGETVGNLREDGASRPRQLFAPSEGLFMPKVPSDTRVSVAEPVAAIVYHEAYLKASLADARPQSTWSCEVYQEASPAKANCKIVEVVRRGSKSLMTATTEPLWFDSARDARVRVSPRH